MSGRLAGLKNELKARREPLSRENLEAAPPATKPATGGTTRAKARVGKRALVGYFSPELSRTLNVIATERDTTLQAILGEAIDLWLREQGRHPFGER